MSILEPSAIDEALEGLAGWRREDDAIHREYRFAGFREAIDFINRVADVAEEANHHPELTNVYSTVEVRLSSHDVGGVTERDLALARAIERASR